MEARDSQGDTALLLAIRRGCFPVVKLLIEDFEADVNVENFAKDKPLMAACNINSLEIVNLLLDYGVERDPAAFELLRGTVAAMIRKRLEIESGDEAERRRNEKALFCVVVVVVVVLVTVTGTAIGTGTGDGEPNRAENNQ